MPVPFRAIHSGPAGWLHRQGNRLRDRLRRLGRDRSGLALVEFALSLPILLILTSSGLELANYVITTKRIGEIAVLIADNASRMGAQSAINNRPISEAEINDVFIGADMQGSGLNLATQSRIILSSLQQNEEGGQWIKWQRCFGTLPHPSSYGDEDEGRTGTSFLGMGPPNSRVTAAPNSAVMVVEISYRYQRIIPLIALPLNDISEVAAFNVRDSRDLTEIYNTENVTPSTCGTPAAEQEEAEEGEG
ncbi:TadE family protein [Sphingobium cloacae]|uniref:Pilus assembly protein n=1 Tax=Sphingobium cloacae TaxID=120107 RepID=A0A1E1F0V5_9SPHN|nr:TadE family protein [Sphingobium cloacae]BAV64149.1 hypothetical protein SCLO_1011090 [Sphingobium cloacae]